MVALATVYVTEDDDATGPDFVPDDFLCDLCERSFKSKKGLSIHKGYAHKKGTSKKTVLGK